MSDRTLTQSKTAAPTFTPVNSGVLQRSAVSNQPVNGVPPIARDVLRSSGQALDPATRAFMAPRFGHDFSQMPVHTKTPARLQAKLTVNTPDLQQKADQEADRRSILKHPGGPDIEAFSKKYPGLATPEPKNGLQLTAPQPSFGIQSPALLSDEFNLKLPGEPKKKQDPPALQKKLSIGASNDPLEQEADRVADQVLAAPANPTASSAPLLSFLCNAGSSCFFFCSPGSLSLNSSPSSAGGWIPKEGLGMVSCKPLFGSGVASQGYFLMVASISGPPGCFRMDRLAASCSAFCCKSSGEPGV